MGNMNLVTGYRGAAHVTADDHGSLYAGIFGEGNYVLDRGEKLAATAVSGNKINIADGDLIMQGRHGRIAPGAVVSVTIQNGSQGVKRHDLIVARYTRNASTSLEDLSLVAIKGTAVTGTPADPTYTAGDILNEQAETADFPLYRVVLNGVNIEKIEQLFSVFIPATLGADGKLAVGNIPALGYIKTTQKGAENGVAPLDANLLVPVGNLPKIPISKLPVSNSVSSNDASRIPNCTVISQVRDEITDVENLATRALAAATSRPNTVWIEYILEDAVVEAGGYDKIKAAVDGGNLDIKLKDSSYGAIMHLVSIKDNEYRFMGHYRNLCYVTIAPGDECTEKHPISDD